MKTTKCKLKVINKHFAYSWHEWLDNGVTKSYTKEIIPNPFEVAKNFAILRAHGKKLELPHAYSFWDKWEDDYPDFAKWCYAVVDKCYDVDAIARMDFSKPFDQSIVDAAKGKKTEKQKKQIDASDLIDAELDSEND